jgi:hypothetical protein
MNRKKWIMCAAGGIAAIGIAAYGFQAVQARDDSVFDRMPCFSEGSSDVSSKSDRSDWAYRGHMGALGTNQYMDDIMGTEGSLGMMRDYTDRSGRGYSRDTAKAGTEERTYRHREDRDYPCLDNDGETDRK